MGYQGWKCKIDEPYCGKCKVHNLGSHENAILYFAPITEIIVHDGTAHMDDTICVSLALALNPNIKVTRTGTVPREKLKDQNVLVCDVGDDFDRDYRNLDHHNCCAAIGCSAQVLLKMIDVNYAKDNGWLNIMGLMDIRGVATAKKSHKLGECVFELMGMPHGFLKAALENLDTTTLRSFGAYILNDIKQYHSVRKFVDEFENPKDWDRFKYVDLRGTNIAPHEVVHYMGPIDMFTSDGRKGVEVSLRCAIHDFKHSGVLWAHYSGRFFDMTQEAVDALIQRLKK